MVTLSCVGNVFLVPMHIRRRNSSEHAIQKFMVTTQVTIVARAQIRATSYTCAFLDILYLAHVETRLLLILQPQPAWGNLQKLKLYWTDALKHVQIRWTNFHLS